MKKIFLILGVCLPISVIHLQAQVTTTTTIPVNQSLSATSLFTNDETSLTALQTLECTCGPDYQVYSLHLSNNYISISYTFQPNYTYVIAVNASASASGNLTTPADSLITFGVSMGAPVTTQQGPYAAINNNDYTPILDYPGQVAFVPNNNLHLSFHGFSAEDWLTPFLTSASLMGSASLPNSATTSTLANFPLDGVGSSVSGINIESYPLMGTMPPEPSPDNLGQFLNPTTPPTNTTLTINSVVVYQTTALLHATITGSPGWTINTVPSGVSSYYQSGVVGCLIIEGTTTPTDFTKPVFVATITGIGFLPTATRTFTAVGTGGGQWQTTIYTNGQVYTQWISGNPPPTLPAGTPFNIIVHGNYSI